MWNANQAWCFLFFTCLTYFWHSFWFCTCYYGSKAAYWQVCAVVIKNKGGLEPAKYKNDSRTQIFSFSLFSLFAILKAVYNYVWSRGTDGSLLCAFMKKKNPTTQEATCSCVIKCLFSCRCFLTFIFTFTKDKIEKLCRVALKAAHSVTYCKEKRLQVHWRKRIEMCRCIELETGRARKIQPVF